MSRQIRALVLTAIASAALIGGCSSGQQATTTSTTSVPTETTTQTSTATATQTAATGGPTGQTGAWTYTTTGGTRSAATTSASGVTLTMVRDDVYGRSAHLSGGTLTADYIDNELCKSSSTSVGCKPVVAKVGGTELEVLASVPEGKAQVGLNNERELWDAIVAGGGTLQLVFIEKSTGNPVQFDFAVDGADPDFY